MKTHTLPVLIFTIWTDRSIYGTSKSKSWSWTYGHAC